MYSNLYDVIIDIPTIFVSKETKDIYDMCACPRSLY